MAIAQQAGAAPYASQSSPAAKAAAGSPAPGTPGTPTGSGLRRAGLAPTKAKPGGAAADPLRRQLYPEE